MTREPAALAAALTDIGDAQRVAATIAVCLAVRRHTAADLRATQAELIAAAFTVADTPVVAGRAGLVARSEVAVAERRSVALGVALAGRERISGIRDGRRGIESFSETVGKGGAGEDAA